MDPNDVFLAEATKALALYYNIFPYDSAVEAVNSLWGDYEKHFGEPPLDWALFAEKLHHPQFQATVAWYRAIGPYRLNLGLPASPPELPELTIPEPAAEPITPVALLPIPVQVLALEPEPEPPPNFVPLKPRGSAGRPREVLTLPKATAPAKGNQPLLERLDNGSQSVACFGLSSRAQADLELALEMGSNKKLRDWMVLLLREVNGQNIQMLDIMVLLPQRSPEMARLISLWMNSVRFDFSTIKLFFKEAGRTPA